MKRVARSMLWLRIQERPLELTVYMVAFITSASNLIGRYNGLAIFALAFYVVLLIGGVCGVVGRLRDNCSAESVGLALMIGGFLMSGLRNLAVAQDAVDYTRVALNIGSLVIGLHIRLLVVRKALRVRRRSAAILREIRSG